MRVIEIAGGSGPAEALVIGERPLPEPAPGQVRICVQAAGINRPDLVQRNGAYPPPPGASDILGLEVAGVIDSLGDGVANWAVSDAVCALLGGGGYAEYVTVDARHVLSRPRDLTPTQAAALPETVFTVFANVFETGRLQSGETLLIHGATSGIGVTAIQMAKAAGARVIATSRSEQKTAAALELGADVSLDATTTDLRSAILEAGGVDVVLDMVGADYAALNQAVLKPGGRWVVIAALTGSLAQIDLMRLMLKRITLTGSTLRSRPVGEKARLTAAVRTTVWPWIEAGRLIPPIAATFPLEEAAAAHRMLESGRHIGKIVLTV